MNSNICIAGGYLYNMHKTYKMLSNHKSYPIPAIYSNETISDCCVNVKLTSSTCSWRTMITVEEC